MRRDAAANRDRLLAAAAAMIRRHGSGVPLAKIAEEAGVGVGTLYRRYPSRDALLAALTHRSFQLVLDTAQHAANNNDTAINQLRAFLEHTIGHGADLVLPLHGGPVPLDHDTIALRAEVHHTLERILQKGQHDRTIRGDVSALDIVVFGALLAQPLPHTTDWPTIARQQANIFLSGLGPTATARSATH